MGSRLRSGLGSRLLRVRARVGLGGGRLRRGHGTARDRERTRSDARKDGGWFLHGHGAFLRIHRRPRQLRRRRCIGRYVQHTAGQQATCAASTSATHALPLIRTWDLSSATKPAVPCVGGAAHLRNSGSTCGTAGPRAQQRVHVRNSGSTCRTAGPRAEQRVHVRNSGWARELPRWSVPGPRPRDSEAGGVSAAILQMCQRNILGRR